MTFQIRAATTFMVDSVNYCVTSANTVSVIKLSSCNYAGNLVIPDHVENEDVVYAVTAAEDGVFQSSPNLVSIALPSSLISLGTAPFSSCRSLEAVVVDENNAAYCSIDGVLYNKDITTLITCPARKSGNFVVPATVTTIAPRAFFSCGVSSVSFSGLLTTMGEFAFGGCSLRDITLPEGLSELPSMTFYGCTSLSNVHLPGSIRTIGYNAFYNCLSLKKITLPEGLNIINEYAFEHCTNLVEVNLPGTLRILRGHAFQNCTSLSSIILPKSVYQVGVAPFMGCTSLTSILVEEGGKSFVSIDGVLLDADAERLVACPCRKVGSYTMPSTVVTIDDYAFDGCKQLTTVNLSPSLTMIGERAFYGCSSLKYMKLPSKVIDIGIRAMRECSSLQWLYVYPVTPPAIYNTTFAANQDNLPVYVPRRSLEAYKTALFWRRFTTILPIMEELAANPLDVYPGTRNSLSLYLDNAEDGLRGYAFDITFPEGFHLIDGSWKLSKRHREGASLKVTPIGDNTFHMKCDLAEGATIEEHSGVVMTLDFIVDEKVKVGDYLGEITNAMLTCSDNVETVLDNSSIDLYVIPGLLGDVDLSGSVSVTDVTLTVDHILGNASNFIWQLGDMNKDGMITVGDITMLVDTILGKDGAN